MGIKNIQLAVDLDDNVVKLEVIFQDKYSARVYFDDVVERLQSGEGITVCFVTPAGSGIVERGTWP